MAEPETLVIRQSTLKISGLLIVALVFVAIGMMMTNDPDGSARQSVGHVHFWGWAGIVFFGFVALVGAAQLVHPPTITLTSEGFALRQFNRRDFFRWSSIDEFFVWKVRGAQMAAWRRHDLTPEFGATIRVSRSFGADGSVGSGWSRSPQEIVTLFQAWKDRHAP